MSQCLEIRDSVSWQHRGNTGLEWIPFLPQLQIAYEFEYIDKNYKNKISQFIVKMNYI